MLSEASNRGRPVSRTAFASTLSSIGLAQTPGSDQEQGVPGAPDDLNAEHFELHREVLETAS